MCVFSLTLVVFICQPTRVIANKPIFFEFFTLLYLVVHFFIIYTSMQSAKEEMESQHKHLNFCWHVQVFLFFRDLVLDPFMLWKASCSSFQLHLIFVIVHLLLFLCSQSFHCFHTCSVVIFGAHWKTVALTLFIIIFIFILNLLSLSLSLTKS